MPLIHRRRLSLLLSTILVWLAPCRGKTYNDERFSEVVQKLESDALEFRNIVEQLYVAARCDKLSLEGCFQSNYDECRSWFPNPVCPLHLAYHLPQCGGGATASTTATTIPDSRGELDEVCASGVSDLTVSTIRLPPGSVNRQGHPRDARIIESVCFSAGMDPWLQTKLQADQNYWDELGFQPRGFYFGSYTGAFRIFPARHSARCNAYDPRIRDWYVAGSSGRKNVIMVLDKSGSMDGYLMNMLKEAAKRVVDTLTDGDRVAIVAFDTEAQVIAYEDQFLFSANNVSKAVLHEKIDALRARGQTNFYDAFDKAFDVLDASILEELDTSCNTAILFFTDGKLNVPGSNVTEDDVMNLVETRMARTKVLVQDKPILFFAYSITEMESDADIFPEHLACRQDLGTSATIADSSQITEALSSYYLLFALGLGADMNNEFVAWVEPYTFTTGNILGTTVSVPVYDRTKQPHLFIGVVAIDIALNALAAALGAAYNPTTIVEAINRLARRSQARCPSLDLTPCVVKFYQEALTGRKGRCGPTCASDDFVETQAKQCTTSDNYPTDIYANRVEQNNATLPFEKYGCCAEKVPHCSGTEADNDEILVVSVVTDNAGLDPVVIAVITVGGVIAVIGMSGIIFWMVRKKRGHGHVDDEQWVRPPPTAPTAFPSS